MASLLVVVVAGASLLVVAPMIYQQAARSVSHDWLALRVLPPTHYRVH